MPIGSVFGQYSKLQSKPKNTHLIYIRLLDVGELSFGIRRKSTAQILALAEDYDAFCQRILPPEDERRLDTVLGTLLNGYNVIFCDFCLHLEFFRCLQCMDSTKGCRYQR